MSALSTRLWGAAWPLLVAANLLWTGNIIMGRAVAGQVPPVALAGIAGPAPSWWRRASPGPT